MGCRLIALIKDSTALTLAGAMEGKGHHALVKMPGKRPVLERTGMSPSPTTSLLCWTEGKSSSIFPSPEATLQHLRIVAQHRRAMVIGTTGFSRFRTGRAEITGQQVPCVLSPNMSVGVNLIYKVIGEMAKTLGDDYDIEVIEAHHRLKKDAPSGTALKIAEVLARAVNRDLNQVGVYARKGLIGERKKGEIGIQTIRAGDIVGDHTILFGGMGERIEVTHRASSRDTFAGGALRAAGGWFKQPPGLYDMMDVLNLK